MPMITRFASPRRGYGFVILALATALVSSGCSTTRARPQWVESITFWEKRETDDRYLKRTPAEEIEDLRATMEKVPSMAPEEQNAKASELAEAYRNESDPLVRLEMLRVVARCGSPVAAETLKAAMGDSDREVRVTACQAWGVHGGPLAVPQLSEALRKDVSVDVRLAAGKALGQIGGDEAVKALAVALDDQDPALQYRAIQSLREITGKDFGDNVVAWRDYTRGSGTPTEISMTDRMKLKAF